MKHRFTRGMNEYLTTLAVFTSKRMYCLFDVDILQVQSYIKQKTEMVFRSRLNAVLLAAVKP
jgi:hypothetical protein